MKITLPDLNLADAERRLVAEALKRTPSLVEAAELLGTNRHALRRLISKHALHWWPYAQQQPRWRGHAKLTLSKQRACAGEPRG